MNHDVISGLACLFCMVYIVGLLFKFHGMYSLLTRKVFAVILSICLIYFLMEYVNVSFIITVDSLRPYYSLMCFSGLILLITHIHSISVKMRRKTMTERIEKVRLMAGLPLQSLGNTDILNNADTIMHNALQNGISRTARRYIQVTTITAWAGFAVSTILILYTLFPHI